MLSTTTGGTQIIETFLKIFSWLLKAKIRKKKKKHYLLYTLMQKGGNKHWFSSLEELLLLFHC